MEGMPSLPPSVHIGSLYVNAMSLNLYISLWHRWVGMSGSGGWNFMAFCKKHAFIDDDDCGQVYTSNGANIAGSQLAVSPGYQLTYGSIIWQAPGTWLGLTFRKQLQRILEVTTWPHAAELSSVRRTGLPYAPAA